MLSATLSSTEVEDEAFYSEAINSELFGHRSSLMDDYSAWRQDIQETVSPLFTEKTIVIVIVNKARHYS